MIHLALGVHDPDGRMAKQIKIIKPAVSLFDSVTCGVTPGTLPVTSNQLQKAGYKVVGGGLPDVTRVKILREIDGDVFYTDLDKLIHQQRFFPKEILYLSSNRPTGYTIIGRTKKAFASCPPAWQETEKPVNDLVSKMFGKEMDVLTGPFQASREFLQLIIDKSTSNTWTSFLEYLCLAKANNISIDYLALDGMEWEDPDRYETEIKQEGYEQWKKRVYDSKKEWKKRRRIAEEWLKYLEKTKNAG